MAASANLTVGVSKMRSRLHSWIAVSLMIFGGPLSARADESVFKLENNATNGCILFVPPAPGMIIAGRLRTLFCNNTSEQLLHMENDVSHAVLRFRLGVGDRCIHVRTLDMQTLPGDIFANECGSNTSVWNVFSSGPSDLVTIHLFTVLNPDSHCLAVDNVTTRIQIAECADKPEQKWRKVFP